MKKVWRMLLLAGVFTVLLCVSALAAGEGICEVSGNLKPLTAEDGEVTESAGVYVGAKKVALTYSPAKTGSYYLVLALLDDGSETVTPTVSNITYIDQDTAKGDTVTFKVYPSKLENGKTYKVYLSSNDGTLNKLDLQGSFSYTVPYKLGDVDANDVVNASDALKALQIAGDLLTPTENQRLAADVTGDKTVNAVDALRILQYAGGLITEWGKVG